MGKGKDAKGLFACCAGCCAISICCLVFILVLALGGYSIAKIVIGAIYLHDCDIQDKIPIFLIVSGVVAVLYCGCGNQSGDGDDDGLNIPNICGIIGFLFNISWHIAGSVWVYGTWSTLKSDTYIPCAPDNATDGCTPGSCHEVLLTFAFVTCTTEWVLIGAAIVGISWKVYHICFKKEIRETSPCNFFPTKPALKKQKRRAAGIYFKPFMNN